MIMVVDRISVTREIDSLIDQQIHTLSQDAEISKAELTEHTQRSRRIRTLCRSLSQGKSPNWISNQSAADALLK